MVPLEDVDMLYLRTDLSPSGHWPEAWGAKTSPYFLHPVPTPPLTQRANQLWHYQGTYHETPWEAPARESARKTDAQRCVGGQGAEGS